MFEMDEYGVYLRVAPSQARRVFALGAYYALGALIIWLAMSSTMGFLAKILMIFIGAIILYFAERLRRGSTLSIELTEEGLRDTSGEMLARWDQIAAVERGSFAIKPSNGFSLRLNEVAPRRWIPGLWWRTRRRVGVGGVLRGREARFMAEQLALQLAQRENGAS